MPGTAGRAAALTTQLLAFSRRRPAEAQTISLNTVVGQTEKMLQRIIGEGQEERRELRRDYLELERARDRFYATWNGSPGKAKKFERWYAGRKAELDRKRIALARW